MPRIIGFKFSEEPQTNWLFRSTAEIKKIPNRHHRGRVLSSRRTLGIIPSIRTEPKVSFLLRELLLLLLLLLVLSKALFVLVLRNLLSAPWQIEQKLESPLLKPLWLRLTARSFLHSSGSFCPPPPSAAVHRAIVH